MENYNIITIGANEWGYIGYGKDGLPVVGKPGLIMIDMPTIIRLKGNHIKDSSYASFLDMDSPDQLNMHLPAKYPPVWNLSWKFATPVTQVTPSKEITVRQKDGTLVHCTYTQERTEGDRRPVYIPNEDKEPNKRTDNSKSDNTNNKLGRVPDSSATFHALYPNI